MRLVDALSLSDPIQAAFSGAGGKTTAMFRLARQLAGPVFVTTTTHLGLDQVNLADRHFVINDAEDLESYLKTPTQAITLFTGPETADGRVSALDELSLNRIHTYSYEHGFPLLIEADGSRGLPLKAPAGHEPAIPAWVNAVIYMAGMAGINQPLSPDFVHRTDQFAKISGLAMGDLISPDAVVRVLSHPEGGLKNIPDNARRFALLNQADTADLQSMAGKIAYKAMNFYDAVLIGSLAEAVDEIKAVYKPVAGIILAAGGSTRFGQSKPLLLWHGQPFARVITEIALQAGLDPVIIITGFKADLVSRAVEGLRADILYNAAWMEGQSTSVRAGINALPSRTGAALFLLADQPQVSLSIIRALIERHRQNLSPIVAPMIGGKRANPVLFDRATFPALSMVSGDSGGRQVFSKFNVAWLEWNDASLLLDVDTPEDYQKLLDLQQ